MHNAYLPSGDFFFLGTGRGGGGGLGCVVSDL